MLLVSNPLPPKKKKSEYATEWYTHVRNSNLYVHRFV
jgi:hypothetical protein